MAELINPKRQEQKHHHAGNLDKYVTVGGSDILEERATTMCQS